MDDGLRLGDLLLADGVVTQDDLDKAERHQMRFGGKLGTALLAVGAVKAETIERYLVAQEGRRSRRPTIRFECAMELARLTEEALRKAGVE